MADTADLHEAEQFAEQDHEPERLFAGPVLIVGVSVLILVVVTILFLSWAFSLLALEVGPMSAGDTWAQRTEGAGVQANQAYDLRQLEHAMENRLHSYGWQREDEQIAHIPIERAMEIAAERQVQINWPKQTDQGGESGAASPQSSPPAAGGDSP